MKLLYFLVGDSFLTGEKSKALISRLEKEYPEGVALQTFYLKDISLPEILTQARTLPFLTSFQVFRILEAERLKSSDVDALAQYCDSPSPSTLILFELSSLDRRSRLASLAGKKGEIAAFEDRAKQSASAGYIRQKLKQAGKRMAPAAQRRLEETAGEMPSFLDSILSQLILYSQDHEEITEDMFEKFEEKLSSVDVFKLVDAISSRNTAMAVRLFYDFADENSKDLLSFVGLLHWQLRRLWCAKVLMEEGAPENIVLKKCKILPRQARAVLGRVRNLQRETLEQAIEDLFQLDWDVKTGRSEDRQALESWIVKLTAAS